MTLCPGLVGETVPAAMFRTFLGAPPQLAVEKRLLRHMTTYTSVGPWFISRRRIREAANEFVELDGSTTDPEIMLRHSHIFFVRRQLFQELLEKQLSILESGKPPKEAEPELLACLGEINSDISARVLYEKKRLEHAKSISEFPHRRELQPSETLERWDTMCMLRCLEQDVVFEEYRDIFNQANHNHQHQFSREFVSSCEAQAKAFLPLSAVTDSAEKLAQLFVRIGASVAADAAQIPQQLKPLDKKDEKLLLKTFIPGDYQKTGINVPRLRPTDATSVFRFYGERVLTGFDSTNKSKTLDPIMNFRRAMWGNVFRRYATNPSFLSSSMSQYWAAAAAASSSSSISLHPQPPLAKMPFSIADIVCRQQVDICPATKLRAQFMYCHQDHAKQLWRSDMTVPSLRMLSATGAQCSEDMLCSVLVDAFFNELEGRQVGGANNSNSNNNTEVSADKNKNPNTTEINGGKQQQDQQQDAANNNKKTSATTRMLLLNNSSSIKSSMGGDTSNNSSIPPLLSDERMRQVISFVNEMISLRSSSLDTLLQRAQTSLKNGVCPPLSDDEMDWSPPVVVGDGFGDSTTMAAIEGDDDDDENENENDQEEEAEDEGVEEEAASEIPNEKFVDETKQ